jgi:Flp pilus assembly protein TadG
MRNLLQCRRGTVAFATVIALIPLIGVVALGAEAGSWYVTKQHAQNAADNAAMSGAMTLAIQNSADPALSDSQSYDYRGNEIAAQNAFCNAGASFPGSRCVASLPSGVLQTVQVTQLASWNGTSGTFVRANVSQQQPAYLAGILGLSTVTIGATAVAQVIQPKQICGLGLGRYSGKGSPTSALEFAGSETMSGNGCGFQSDNTVKYASAPSFNGTGWAVYSSTGCVHSGTCDPGVPFNYSMQPATNPLSKLDSESFNSATTNNPPKQCQSSPCTISPNSPTAAYGDLKVTNGNTVTFTSGGTYFFYNANITINGGTVTGTSVNIVLLGTSSLSITGGTVTLSANFNNTTYPDLNGVLFDDQAPNKSNLAVTINGGASVTIALGGSMYFPNVDVTMSGNSQNANTNCTEVVANSIKFGGGTNYLSTQGCATTNTVPMTQVVVLVQ